MVQVLTSRLEAIERKYGLQDRTKVRDDAIFDMYKSHIKSLRAQVGGRACAGGLVRLREAGVRVGPVAL